jgi:hypothetical protein
MIDFNHQNRDELDELIDEAEAMAGTEWEVTFVGDMRSRFDSDPSWHPTELQIEKLEEIAGN